MDPWPSLVHLLTFAFFSYIRGCPVFWRQGYSNPRLTAPSSFLIRHIRHKGGARRRRRREGSMGRSLYVIRATEWKPRARRNRKWLIPMRWETWGTVLPPPFFPNLNDMTTPERIKNSPNKSAKWPMNKKTENFQKSTTADARSTARGTVR